jgi:hypothetical protein
MSGQERPSVVTIIDGCRRHLRYLRDVLDRLEQLRLLPSAERWEEIRAARNSLAHDYPATPAQRAARPNLAEPMVDEMANILERLASAYRHG